MADSSNSGNKLERSSMVELSDELIVEIIARLPLKYATQCLLLNKTFYHLISHPTFLRRTALLSESSNSTLFHCSGNNPKIFTRNSRQRIPNFQVSITLDGETSVLASCNGVLLLRFHPSYQCYVFNPLTCGIMFVDHQLDFHDDVGLAVDFAAEKFHFKLVALDISPGLLRFSVVVPSARGFGSSTVMLKSEVDFVCETFTLIKDKSIRPVYAHGCLYWLEGNRRKTVAFDVQKEQERMINGAIKKNKINEFHSADGKWFGLADGSIRFIYTLRDDIVIHSLDRFKDKWQVKHKIANICSPSNNDYRNGVPLFFDGRHLFLHLRKRGEDGVVHIYDFLTDTWKKCGNVGGWTDWAQFFFRFFPTLGKVSDQYLHQHNNLLWEIAAFENSFLGLQQLLGS